jgi:predicted O-methyltransferase YrrM
MHCGPQKGVVLEEFLLERYRAHQRQQQQQPPPQPFVVVELGSYCGYSSIRMARALSSLSSSTETNDFRIYSIDVQPKLLRIATEMTRLAGLDHCISFHLLRKNTSLHHLLQEILGADEEGGNRSEQQGTKDDTTVKMVHFCLLDHAKDLYLSDLLQLERHGHLRQGSAVAADNVIFARIDDYRRHVQSAAYISTRLVAGPLEYQDEIPDGIGASLLCFCFVLWLRRRPRPHDSPAQRIRFFLFLSRGTPMCIYVLLL